MFKRKVVLIFKDSKHYFLRKLTNMGSSIMLDKWAVTLVVTYTAEKKWCHLIHF